jgi:glucose dehydrogenase
MWHQFQSRPLLAITGATILLLGAYFLVGGTWLIWLGGSWYYAVAGIGLMVTGWFIAAGRRLGIYVYALVWLGTLCWAFAESGANVWYLMPRLLAPTVLGLYLLMPFITAKLDGGRAASRYRFASARVSAVTLICAVAVAVVMSVIAFARNWPADPQSSLALSESISGTPYLAAVGPWLGAFVVPCNAPKWGELTAVDLSTRKVLWRTTLGTSRDNGPFNLKTNLPLPTGAPNLGGSVITRSGLVS